MRSAGVGAVQRRARDVLHGAGRRAILYVICEIWVGVRRQGHTELGLYMLGAGFLLGIATDLVVAYGGA